MCLKLWQRLLDASSILWQSRTSYRGDANEISKREKEEEMTTTCMVLNCLALRRLSTAISFSFLFFFAIIASYMYQKLNLHRNLNTWGLLVLLIILSHSSLSRKKWSLWAFLKAHVSIQHNPSSRADYIVENYWIA